MKKCLIVLAVALLALSVGVTGSTAATAKTAGKCKKKHHGRDKKKCPKLAQ